MRKPLFFKILAGYLTIVVLLVAVFLSFAFDTIKSSSIDAAAKSLAGIGNALMVTVRPLVESKGYETVDAFAKARGKEVAARITVVLADGVVVADSEESPRSMENHRTRTEVAQALEGGTGRFMRRSETLKQDMLYVALPVKSGETVIGALRLSFYLKDMEKTIDRLWLHLARVSILTAALAILLSLWLSRSLSRPIGELRAAARRVGDRDFNARVFLRSNDELKDLADSFNDMIRETALLVSQLRHQKGELNTILSSLQEGLLVLDGEDKGLLASESFLRICRQPAVEGRYHWELVREPNLSELVRRVRQTGQNGSGEVTIDGRVYLCNATYLESGGEVAIIFHDITDLRNLERIKTDFVLSVSHELRTPLTSIKGFIETLEAEVEGENQRRYVEIISRNTDRVINIINDLLRLAEMEEKNARLETTPLDMAALVDDIARFFQPRVDEKGLTLEVAVDAGAGTVTADPFKLEQILMNLLDNAIKYTETGRVRLSASVEGARLRLVVEDTGPGIAKEHVSRIFERFYVVDKSRSKRLGGTGLGLSIVKHVVLLHGGAIEVETEPGKGTRFIVTLPLGPDVS
jgi:two-component system phosphate regulon sensor histidine kinase PhoR